MPPQPSSALHSVRTNQLSPAATEWFASVLSALDAKDLPRYLSYLSPRVSIIFNNGEMTMDGIEAAREGLGQFWQSFGTLRHEELNIYGTDQNFVHEALNHHTTLDGRDVTIRAVAFIDRDEGGKICSLRLYADQSPLWAREDLKDSKKDGGGEGK